MSQQDSRLLRGISELYTPFERVEQAALVMSGDTLTWVGTETDLPEEHRSLPGENLGGRAVLPGLVDSHTHLVWAGSRLGEYVARSRGAKYEEILEAGGGIHSTVAATRAAGEGALLALARTRAGAFLRGGVTSLEIKSGYGLSTESELSMLRVARELGAQGPQRVTTTLLAHVPDPGVERERYVERFVSETVPAAATGLADAVDVFCDRGAFTLPESRRILEAAKAHRLKVKAHAEQLSHTGAAKLVAELGGVSADHLELSEPSDWEALAAAGSVATILPGAAVILGMPLPRAAALRESGVKTAIASDHNPGSSPLFGLLPALQLATALAGFSVEEALVAGTANAADALAQPRWGRLAPGSYADFLVVDGSEALLPLYSWGHSRLYEVVIGGTSVWRKDG